MYLRNELRAHAAVYKAIKALPGEAHSSPLWHFSSAGLSERRTCFISPCLSKKYSLHRW